MKQGSEKSRTNKGIKKKKRKKLDTRTKIHAVLAAAVLILAALVISLTALYLRSAKIKEEAALVEEPAPVPETQTPTENTQAPIVKAPPPVTQETSAPVKAPAANNQAPAVKPPVTAPVPVPAKPPVAPPAARPVTKPTTPPAAAPTAAEKKPPARSPEPQRPSPRAGGAVERQTLKGSLAFVIDDAGNNLRDLEPFLKFPGSLTIAVLPGLANSAEAARRIRAAGKEVFLHQPMESLGGSNPGPGAIRIGMGSEEIRSIVNRNLDEIWPVAGLNNHEGSRVTMDDEAMETVLAICRERGIVFLDSRTTAETAAPRVARRLGINIGERDIFVDNIQERESMLGYINSGLVKAEQKGSAIMIGHVTSPALLPLLAELYPDLNERGYSFTTASKLIRGNAQ